MIGETATLFFPLALLLIEIIMRGMTGLNTQVFLGPSLASIAVGFIMPLTQHKSNTNNIPPQVLAALQNAPRFIITGRYEREIRTVFWILTIIFMGVWAWSIYSSITDGENSIMIFLPMLTAIPSFWIGLISYLAAVVLYFVEKPLRNL